MSQEIETAAMVADWLSILDQVDQSIGRGLADVSAQERALDDADQAVHADLATAEQHTLVDIDNRLSALQSRLLAANEAAQQMEELLNHDEAEVQDWKVLLGSVGQHATRLGESAVSCTEPRE